MKAIVSGDRQIVDTSVLDEWTPDWISDIGLHFPAIVTFNNGHFNVADLTPPADPTACSVVMDRLSPVIDKQAIMWLGNEGGAKIIVTPQGLFHWENYAFPARPARLAPTDPDTVAFFTPKITVDEQRNYRFTFAGEDQTWTVTLTDVASGISGVASIDLGVGIQNPSLFIGRRSGWYYDTCGPTFALPDQTRIISIT